MRNGAVCVIPQRVYSERLRVRAVPEEQCRWQATVSRAARAADKVTVARSTAGSCAGPHSQRLAAQCLTCGLHVLRPSAAARRI